MCEEMRKETVLFVAGVIAVILVMGTVVYMSYLIYDGDLKGKDGVQGIPGVQGKQGVQGIQGEQGRSIVGPQGSKGDRGSTGSSGSRGPPGKDAPINNPPVISLVNFSGVQKKCSRYDFVLDVNVSDADDTNLSIEFFTSSDGVNFSQSMTQFDSGVHVFQCSSCSHILYVGVVAWDGSDVSNRVFRYSVGE